MALPFGAYPRQFITFKEALQLFEYVADNPQLEAGFKDAYTLDEQHINVLKQCVRLLRQKHQHGLHLDVTAQQDNLKKEAVRQGWPHSTDAKNPTKGLRNKTSTLFARYVILWMLKVTCKHPT